MIGHFPPPHPDELLYSVCARFADQVHYPGTEDVVQNLFGTRRFPGSIHLPVHLDHLVSVITPGHRFTVDQFIDEHTLFPFYAPFLQSEHPSEIRKAMRLSGGTSAQARIGRVAEQHRWPSQLRACPHCVREDRQQFGECYWHRVHQILGVEVCPFHACYLLNSDISTHSRHSFAPISAERAIAENLLLIPGVIENTPLEWQLAIARDAYWLLDQKVESPGLEALARCYRSLLAQQGLATYRGTIRTPKLIAKFSSYYSVEFLRHLRSELKMGERKNWLTSLFQADRLQHPVRHLLLIHFLGYSAETFFTVLLDESPFGKGPWPCLNPVCEHYNQPCIDHCTITYTQSVRHGLSRSGTVRRTFGKLARRWRRRCDRGRRDGPTGGRARCERSAKSARSAASQSHTAHAAWHAGMGACLKRVQRSAHGRKLCQTPPSGAWRPPSSRRTFARSISTALNAQRISQTFPLSTCCSMASRSRTSASGVCSTSAKS